MKKIMYYYLFVPVVLMSCFNSIHIQNSSNKCGEMNYFAVVSEIDRKNYLITLNVMEVVGGIDREKDIIQYVMDSHTTNLSHSKVGDQFFMSGCGKNKDYEYAMKVIGFSRDRFKSLQLRFKELSIEFYTNNYSTEGKLWVPFSCAADIAIDVDKKRCRSDIAIIRDIYNKQEH